MRGSAVRFRETAPFFKLKDCPRMSHADSTRIAEEWAIRRAASEIDRAVDDKNWARMRDQIADRLTVDVGAVSGTSIIEMSGDDFVREVAALNAPEKRSYHVHHNALIEIHGDAASFTAHSHGWNHCEVLDPPVYEIWGTIDYRFERKDGRWLVTHIAMAKWREQGNPAVSTWKGSSAR
jgi:hypothetical protein